MANSRIFYPFLPYHAWPSLLAGSNTPTLTHTHTYAHAYTHLRSRIRTRSRIHSRIGNVSRVDFARLYGAHIPPSHHSICGGSHSGRHCAARAGGVPASCSHGHCASHRTATGNEPVSCSSPCVCLFFPSFFRMLSTLVFLFQVWVRDLVVHNCGGGHGMNGFVGRK